MNKTIFALSLSETLRTSPFFVSSPLKSTQNLIFNGINSIHSLSSFFTGFSPNSNIHLSKSHFCNSLKQVLHYEGIIFQTISTHQNYNDEFSLTLYSCVFNNIKNEEGMGGAFVAISDIHSLHCEYCHFINCSTSGSGMVGLRSTPVGGGAFVFVGALSEVSFCCFVGCKATSNTQTMHSYIFHSGSNKIIHCFFYNNGNNQIKSHTLFSLDAGKAEINGINSSSNVVPGGYAGGHVGWFAVGSNVIYSNWEHNKGKSVFGSCAYDSDHCTFLNFVQFRWNVATRYGVYNRLTGKTHFSIALFAGNEGLALWGNAPISLSRAYFDCQRPPGAMKEEMVVWNWSEERTFNIQVEKNCPIAPTGNV